MLRLSTAHLSQAAAALVAMPNRLGQICLLVLTAALLAGCGETATTPAPTPTLAATPTGPIAFEPITGLPDSTAATLAAALGQRAAGRDLVVLSKSDSKVRYRVKGYFAAQSSTERTTVSYIWDVFDKDNARVHRFDGLAYAPSSGASDPWGAVQPETLDAIADATTGELARFLSVIGAAGAPKPKPSAKPSTKPTAFFSPGAMRRNSAPRYFITGIDSDISDAATALPAALTRALAASGVAMADDASHADVFVSAETAIAPAEKGRQMVAIIWTAKRRDGTELGSVRQVSRVLQNTLDHGWGQSAETAAEAAGPALVEIVNRT